MKIWSVANQKGGVGKTTTAVTLAGLLSSKGQRVLVIDLDPHGSLSSYLGVSESLKLPGAYWLFSKNENFTREDVMSLIVPTDFKFLYVMPSSLALSTLDRYIGKKEKIGLVIFSAIKKVSKDFDFVIIDCPPVAGVLMVNALAACDQLLIPVQTEFLALKGLERMVDTVKMVSKSKGIDLDYLVIPTLFDQRTNASIEALRIIRELYSSFVWPSVIPVDTKFRDASQHGMPLSYYSPSSKGVVSYNLLLKNLIQHIVLKNTKSVVKYE